MPLTPVSSADWHTLPASAVCEQLQSTEEGLSSSEAKSRLQTFGPNELPHTPPPSCWQILLRQFYSPLIYILAAAAVVSLAIDEPTDAAFIVGVLVLNAAIGGYQEWKAEQSAQALQQMLRTRAMVQRDGEVLEIDAEEVVPGDVVWLESGNRVPADLRLANVHGLEIDESLLTGESLAVMKEVDWTGPPQTPLGDRVNMAYAGSVVTRGRARGYVVATGGRTEVGRLALDVATTEAGKPPLLDRMERFARFIAIAIMVAIIVIGIIGIVVQRQSAADVFMFCVALAVSAIPEGLPVAMTIALSIATMRMARRGVIVRKLTAVEGLGSCTLIATDKTGTLTVNALTVRRVELADGSGYDVTGEGFVPEGRFEQEGRPVEPRELPGLIALSRAAVLCNEADLHHRDGSWVWRGDAVDVAFLSLAHKAGVQREPTLEALPEVGAIPFEPERQYAATFHADSGTTKVVVKGAPERVLAMCGGSESTRAEQLVRAESLARQGYRVLAVAEGELAQPLSATEAPPEPQGLRLLGLAGMIDPLRPGVKEAVEACHAAGVGVSMVTGDHRVTALAIASELGLTNREDEVLTGVELAQKPPEKLREIVGRVRVFARVAPAQKLAIVMAAREAGEFVAVTGDGVNDAPALRAANIGVAMGKSGTDVAREAAELVISDDDFTTIVAGVEEGRIAYDNIRKVIGLLISTGAAEIVLVALAVALGTPLPLLPVQLLWLNLVTNGIQHIGLAFEPGEGDTLRRKPRPPSEPIFNRLMIDRTVVAAMTMGVVGFGLFYWQLHNGWSLETARNSLLLLMVLFENVHVGNCRSETKSALVLSPLKSPILLAGTLSAFLIHVIAMHLPLGQRVLATQPVSLPEWVMLLSLALTVFVAVEIHKWILSRRG